MLVVIMPDGCSSLQQPAYKSSKRLLAKHTGDKVKICCNHGLCDCNQSGALDWMIDWRAGLDE
jgi:hypothetical protein